MALAQVLVCNAQASSFSASSAASAATQLPEKLEQIASETIRNRLQSLTPIPYATEPESSTRSRWNSYELTPSQSFLKMTLGNEYIVGDDMRNLMRFNELFPPSHGGDPIDNKYTTVLAECLIFEKKEYEKGNLVSYHGLMGELLFFYKYVAKINSLISGRDIHDSSLSLRGSQIVFINPKTKKPYENAWEVYSRLGSAHYGRERSTIFMSVNPMLTMRSYVSKTSESSIYLLFNNDSVEPPQIKSLVIEMLTLQGMSIEYAEQCYHELHSLYEQFYGHRGNNGGILAISVPWSLADTHITDPSEDPSSMNPEFTSQMVEAVQKKATEMPSDRKNFKKLGEAEQRAIREITNESRLYLDPTKNFKVFSRFRYNLSPEDQQKFDLAFDKMIEIHAIRLLRSQHIPLENAFILDPTSRHLTFQFIKDCEAATKTHLTLTYDAKALPILIEKDSRDVIEALLQIGQVQLDPRSPEQQKAIIKVLSFKYEDRYDKPNRKNEFIKWINNVLAKQAGGFSLKDFVQPYREYMRVKIFEELLTGDWLKQCSLNPDNLLVTSFVDPEEFSTWNKMIEEIKKEVPADSEHELYNRLRTGYSGKCNMPEGIEFIKKEFLEIQKRDPSWESKESEQMIVFFCREILIQIDSSKFEEFVDSLFSDKKLCEKIAEHLAKNPQTLTAYYARVGLKDSEKKFIKSHLLDKKIGTFEITLKQYIETKIALEGEYSGHEETDKSIRELLAM